MSRKRTPRPASDIPEEAARILFLTYGQDAVHMAELRCSELEAVGDKEGVATWKEVLVHVRTLVAANPEEQRTSH
jgi:hypothetical protein